MILRTAAECQHTKSVANLRTAERSRFPAGEGAEFARAALDDAPRKVICEIGSFGAGTRGIRKDVQIREGALFDKAERGGVVVLGFAGKTGEDIGANRGMRENLADEFDAARVMFGAIPAVHGGKNAIGGGLQRHMEVRGQAMVCGEEPDEVLGDIERLDGADAKAFDGSFAKDLAKEIGELDTRREIAAVGAEIDATEDYLAEAGFREAANFIENRGDRQAAGFAANKRDDTEGTAGVAAVLNLQRGASVIPFPAEDGGDENVGRGEDVAGEDGSGMVGDEVFALRRSRSDGDRVE